MRRPLWREDGSVFYNVQCAIYNTFYCLRFETRSLYLYPPGRGWPGYTPRHWVTDSIELLVLVIQPQHGPHRKCLLHYCMFSRCRGKNVSSELFPSNGSCAVACLHICFLTMDLHVTISWRCVDELVITSLWIYIQVDTLLLFEAVTHTMIVLYIKWLSSNEGKEYVGPVCITKPAIYT
jgi:hypothetical protein